MARFLKGVIVRAVWCEFFDEDNKAWSGLDGRIGGAVAASPQKAAGFQGVLGNIGT